MYYSDCKLKPLTNETVNIISQWEYNPPYNVYSFKDMPNGYLFKEDTWGMEQFCLMNENTVVGQVACQLDGNNLWVGWSLNPQLCNNGEGHLFIEKCLSEIIRIKEFDGDIFLKVVAWNKRAIKAYEKAGFTYYETIKDEIAYSDKLEEFFVMKYIV